MATILTSYTEQEFRQFLKAIILEVLAEMPPGNQSTNGNPMDIQEAAKFLKLEVNTLYEKTSRKLIPHYKKGNKLYFDQAELEVWVKAGKVKSREEIEVEASTYLLGKKAA